MPLKAHERRPHMNNSLSTLVKGLGNALLKNPGDKLEAYVTRTGRQVVKLQQNHGGEIIKRSATKYSTGNIVETIVYNAK